MSKDFNGMSRDLLRRECVCTGSIMISGDRRFQVWLNGFGRPATIEFRVVDAAGLVLDHLPPIDIGDLVGLKSIIDGVEPLALARSAHNG